MRILRVSAFKDNYIWLLVNQHRQAIIVDPGDANPVFDALAKHQLSISAIFITHHHADHVGGLLPLLEKFPVPVFGPNNQKIKGISHNVREEEKVAVNNFPTFSIINCPGHTLDHIAFYSAPYLFCGDTLFAGGCGRMFEGTSAQFSESLRKIAALPSDTQVYCAHEYTESNLAFAQLVEPNNRQLHERARSVESMRAKQLATVPSLLATELATNPFLRSQQASVKQAAEQFMQRSLNTEADIFGAIRKWKDNA